MTIIGVDCVLSTYNTSMLPEKIIPNSVAMLPLVCWLNEKRKRKENPRKVYI